MERGCLAAVGVAIALGSGFFASAAIFELVNGGDGTTEPGVLFGLAVFFGGAAIAGLYLTWRMMRAPTKSSGASRPGPAQPSSPPPPPPPSAADRERLILRHAEKEHGRVTVPEIAVHCDMTVAEAKATLDTMVTQNIAEIHVTDGGVLVYVFPGFLSDNDKAQAQDF